MAALLTGMDLALCMANRLKVYMDYSEQLPSTLARSNFESVLVKMYTYTLRFIANAIQAYQKNVVTRSWEALWQTSELEDFETDSNKLGIQAEIEANNCDRELRERNWEGVKQWKADLGASLQKLDDIRALQSSVDLLHVKVDLSKLATAKGATYNSFADETSPQCLQGTRTELLRQVADWADDPNGKCIFWLCGMAGTGKSTISRTVSNILDKQQRLGASFFFKRGEGDRGNASRFFATIVLQLVYQVPGLDRSIADALESGYEVYENGLQEQYDKLLWEPLASIVPVSVPSSGLIIVIDALDECDRDSDKRNIVRLLARLHSMPALRLRIFLTSRPELPVTLGFRTLAGHLHDDVVLEEVQATTIKHDIRRYLEYQFRIMREEDCLLQPYDPLPTDWPVEEDIETLVGLAIPLFIFAFTVCRYVSEANPRKRLCALLQQSKRTSFSELDKTYLPILNQLVLGLDEREHDRTAQEFRELVGPIVLLADPLSASSLSRLLAIPLGDIDGILRHLQPVLNIPADPTKPIRLLHLSFRDFLVDAHGRGLNRFCVDEKWTHSRLAEQCLQLLNQSSVLKQDLLNLGKPGERRSHVSTEKVSESIPDEIAYACCYWAWHLTESGERIVDGGLVHRFLKQHFLHWLEALSWLGRLSRTIAYVNNLQAVVQVCPTISLEL